MQQLAVCKVANYIPIGDLNFHPKNQELRTITRERLDDLKESIKEKGFYEPILVWKTGLVVLAGEHRTRAAMELNEEGFEFITASGKKNCLPIVLEDCDEIVANQILHESNNHYASWIDDKLKKELREADEAGRNLRQYGYSQGDIDNILTEATRDVDEAIEAASEPEAPVNVELSDDIEKARYESLILPIATYMTLARTLRKMAIILDPEWSEGDSIVEAVDTLCQLIEESEVLDKYSPEG